jgi:hypothetical protein
VTAYDRLTRALLDMAAAGLRTPCSDVSSHHFWLSEHEGERRVAARLCRHCPVELECRESAEANQERWGVWGGVDMSVKPGRKKRAA